MTTQHPQASLPEEQAKPVRPDQDVLDRLLDQLKGRFFTFGPYTGFLGSLLCNHTLIWDEQCKTAWCNGKFIAFNPDFFLSLELPERLTLLAHELWHTGFDHMSRRNGRDPQIWNWAADYVINGMLDTAGYSFKDMHPLLDHVYDGMTTEEVYDLLIQEYPPSPKLSLEPPCSNGQGGDGDGDDGSAGQGDILRPDPNGNINAPLSGDVREEGVPDKQEIMGKLVGALQSAKMCKQAGDLPGEIILTIEEFLNPVLPWEVLLQKYFSDLSADDYSWRRPSRRYTDEYLPSLMGENGLEHIIYYLDISGSISDAEIVRFNSEVRHIHTDLRPKRLTLVTFDTEIQDVYEFEQDDVFEKITVQGRGGTCLDPVRRHIEKHQPTAAVIFSDLFVTPMHQNPGVPVLWVIVDNPKAQTYHGTNIHMPRHMIKGSAFS